MTAFKLLNPHLVDLFNFAVTQGWSIFLFPEAAFPLVSTKKCTLRGSKTRILCFPRLPSTLASLRNSYSEHAQKVRSDQRLQLLVQAKWNANLSVNSIISLQIGQGPVQTSCFCHAKLNSGIKFAKSTPEAGHLNQTFELSLASN